MIIIYIADHTWQNQLTQIFDATDVSASIKINDFGSATFTIGQDHVANTDEILQLFNDCKITQKIGSTEKTVFHWYIRLVQATWDKTEVECRTFEHLLDRRRVASSASQTGALNTILASLINAINTTYDTGITLDCDVTTSTTIAWSKGESVLTILKKLDGLYDFVIRDKVLYVWETVGIDRTSGDDFWQFKRDWRYPADRNVVNFEVTINGDDLANAIQGKSAWYQTDASSIAEYGRIEDVISNSDGSETAEVTKELVERATPTKNIDIDPDVSDFFFADVGDVVSLYLDAGNPIGQYFGAAKINEKSITFGDLNRVKVKLSESKIANQDLFDRIRATQKRLERLELQS